MAELSLVVYNAVAAVCPVNGVALIDPANSATWRIDYDPSATPAQQTAAQNVITNFNVPLETARAAKQTALDALLDNNFDLKAFIRAGSSTTVTGTNVGNFLATICDNYRSLRSQIAAAANLTALNSININSGWPSNP